MRRVARVVHPAVVQHQVPAGDTALMQDSDANSIEVGERVVGWSTHRYPAARKPFETIASATCSCESEIEMEIDSV